MDIAGPEVAAWMRVVIVAIGVTIMYLIARIADRHP